MTKRTGLGVIVVAALLLAACSGGDDDSGGSSGSGSGKVPECPLSSLDKAAAKGPVEITFWHTMTRANEDALTKLTDRFNASQKKVHVKLLNNNDSDDQHEKYVAQLRTDPSGLPDVVQEQEFFLQQDVDTQSMLPVQACLDAAKVDTSDYVERAMAYYTIDKVQWGLPFAVSEPVLLYSRSSFQQAGLDPDKPPTTFDELRSASQKLKAKGFEAGLALKLDPWHLEQMLAWQGKPFVNNGNGRDKRATAVSFDSEPAAEEIFSFLKGMVDDKLALTTQSEGTGIDNLLDVGARKVGMTIDSSGTLGTIIQVLSSGQYAGINPDVAPVPGRTADGGVLIGGSGLYISARTPAKQAAAWEYMSYLTSPDSQAEWAAATGFIPVRKSASTKPVLQKRWQEIPGFKVAYDEIVEGAENAATAGPAIGDYKGVRDAVKKAESQMYLEGKSPKAALKSAAEKANDLLQSYNSRL